MSVELLPPPADAGDRIALLLARARAQALARADRIAAFGESHRCRQVEIAEHFGEKTAPCGVCDRCSGAVAPRAVATEAPTRELPADIAGAIVDAVRSLERPLGTSGLVATLSGSVGAPPTGRRNGSYGLLAAAPPSRIKGWIGTLVASEHLERFTSEDGYPLLRPGRTGEPLPRLGAPTSATAAAAAAPDGDPLFERLRAWRLERAREDAVPAYVVFSDKTLREMAVVKPASEQELAAVNGVGPAKIERYGTDVLDLVAAFAA
jgi:ATP-dependent DNA helicase RecQ